MSDKGMPESLAKLDVQRFITVPMFNMMASVKKELLRMESVNKLQRERILIQKQRYKLIIKAQA